MYIHIIKIFFQIFYEEINRQNALADKSEKIIAHMCKTCPNDHLVHNKKATEVSLYVFANGLDFMGLC